MGSKVLQNQFFLSKHTSNNLSECEEGMGHEQRLGLCQFGPRICPRARLKGRKLNFLQYRAKIIKNQKLGNNFFLDFFHFLWLKH